MSRGIAQSFLDTLELRRGSVINKVEVAALRRRWGMSARTGPTVDVYDERWRVYENGPYQVCAELEAGGRTWWTQQLFTPSGRVRNTEFTRLMYIRELSAARSGIVSFELADFDVVASGQYIRAVFPMYNMRCQNGEVITFTQRSWQSGGTQIQEYV